MCRKAYFFSAFLKFPMLAACCGVPHRLKYIKQIFQLMTVRGKDVQGPFKLQAFFSMCRS